jgi:hypothetical protein
MGRRSRGFVVSALLALPAALVAACGAERPPIAGAPSPDARAAVSDTTSALDAGGARRVPCIPPAEIEGSPCQCVYKYGRENGESSGFKLDFVLSCGTAICSKGLDETAYCAAHGVLLVVDGFCADASGELPRCDVGDGAAPDVESPDAPSPDAEAPDADGL